MEREKEIKVYQNKTVTLVYIFFQIIYMMYLLVKQVF